jgi:ubiquinone/menaquinone biosynthesis C-methylase UbiE
VAVISKTPTDAVFNVLAAEYYDPILHPTCANFRAASIQIVSRWLEDHQASICDVGCGESVVADILSKTNSSLSNLFLTDSSSAMLEHSRKWERFGAALSVGAANKLPFRDSSFNRVVASLADPFNDPDFWSEAKRVLAPNGLVIFTTPSHEWALTFRRNEPQGVVDKAEFVLRNGQRVWIPSIIHSEQAQTQMINEAGLSVAKVERVTLQDLSGQAISTKLKVLGNPSSPVVTGYIVKP